MAIAASPPPRPRRHLRLVRDGDVAARGCFVPVGDSPRGYQLSLSLVHVPRGSARVACKSPRRREGAAERWLRILAWVLAAKEARPLERWMRTVTPRRGGHRSPLLHQWMPRRSSGHGRLSEADRAEMEADVAELTAAGVYDRRPRTRAECPTGPCGWVSCRFNLYLDVDSARGTAVVVRNFPGLDIDQVPETCALRVADKVEAGEATSFDVLGSLFNVTWMRAQQIADAALVKMRAAIALEDEGDEDE